jgi:hypothetical protein
MCTEWMTICLLLAPYYNVRAGRKQMREGSELVIGDPTSVEMAEKRTERGFNLMGDERVKIIIKYSNGVKL